MAQAGFNASEAVTFDLAFGHVHLDGGSHRVLVPASALVKLIRAAAEDDRDDFAYALGDGIGRRIAVRVAEAKETREQTVKATSVERIATELAGEFALAGLGTVTVERWGQALVLVHDQSPLGEEGDSFVAAVFQSALRALVSAPLRVVKLMREGVRARYLVVNGAVVQGVRDKLSAGESWGAVVAALHGGKRA